MGNSLFDQLKKSGLVDEKKARKAKQGKYLGKKNKPKKGSVEPVNEAKLMAQKAHAEKVERDRELNQQHKEKAQQKAIFAQIKQLIETNRIEDRDGDIAYNFSDGSVVKRIHVSQRIHNHLTSGRLAIAKLGEGYELVPVPVADKIRQRDPQYIIQSEPSVELPVDEDDPYADYKIPDDLMW